MPFVFCVTAWGRKLFLQRVQLAQLWWVESIRLCKSNELSTIFLPSNRSDQLTMVRRRLLGRDF